MITASFLVSGAACRVAREEMAADTAHVRRLSLRLVEGIRSQGGGGEEERLERPRGAEDPQRSRHEDDPRTEAERPGRHPGEIGDFHRGI